MGLTIFHIIYSYFFTFRLNVGNMWENFMDYCQSHITLLWVWIVSCLLKHRGKHESFTNFITFPYHIFLYFDISLYHISLCFLMFSLYGGKRLATLCRHMCLMMLFHPWWDFPLGKGDGCNVHSSTEWVCKKEKNECTCCLHHGKWEISQNDMMCGPSNFEEMDRIYVCS